MSTLSVVCLMFACIAAVSVVKAAPGKANWDRSDENNDIGGSVDSNGEPEGNNDDVHKFGNTCVTCITPCKSGYCWIKDKCRKCSDTVPVVRTALENANWDQSNEDNDIGGPIDSIDYYIAELEVNNDSDSGEIVDSNEYDNKEPRGNNDDVQKFGNTCVSCRTPCKSGYCLINDKCHKCSTQEPSLN